MERATHVPGRAPGAGQDTESMSMAIAIDKWIRKLVPVARGIQVSASGPVEQGCVCTRSTSNFTRMLTPLGQKTGQQQRVEHAAARRKADETAAKAKATGPDETQECEVLPMLPRSSAVASSRVGAPHVCVDRDETCWPMKGQGSHAAQTSVSSGEVEVARGEGVVEDCCLSAQMASLARTTDDALIHSAWRLMCHGMRRRQHVFSIVPQLPAVPLALRERYLKILPSITSDLLRGEQNRRRHAQRGRMKQVSLRLLR